MHLEGQTGGNQSPGKTTSVSCECNTMNTNPGITYTVVNERKATIYGNDNEHNVKPTLLMTM